MIYEYQCQNKKCEHIVERLTFSMKDNKPPKECPKCKGKMKRILSAGGFKMKPWH